MVLGPRASRLVRTSSLFVKQVEVRDEDGQEVVLHGFSQKPELNCETNWTVSKNIVLHSYGRKSLPLWLNRGSRVRMRWEGPTSMLYHLEIVMVQGDQKLEVLHPATSTSKEDFNNSSPINYLDAEYLINDDDKYYLEMSNVNPRSTLITMTGNITSKTYNLTKSTSTCSTIEGSCRIQFSFPRIHYLLMTTPNSEDFEGPNVELSYLTRIISYFVLMALIGVVIFFALKYLGVCDADEPDLPITRYEETPERVPLFTEKPFPYAQRAKPEDEDEDDDDGSSSSSSEDLYDAKLCIICYDEQRNCFFIPCGHCATCYDCAQRIMEGDNKVCPICRKLIHKARRLFSP